MKYLSIIKYVLLLIGAFVGILGMVGVVSVDTMLYWAYATLLFTIGLTIVLPLIGLAKNPKSASKSLIGLALLVVIFGLSYIMAEVTPVTMADGTIYDNETGLLVADMGLWATYFMFAGTLLAIIGSEVYKLFK